MTRGRHPVAEPKACACCGRSIEWRAKWARTWESVRFCSARCRTTRRDQRDEQLEQATLALLHGRAAHGSICPSEAARMVFGQEWEPEMERARQAARRLVARGLVEITQRGRVVDPDAARGPIRVRLVRCR